MVKKMKLFGFAVFVLVLLDSCNNAKTNSESNPANIPEDVPIDQGVNVYEEETNGCEPGFLRSALKDSCVSMHFNDEMVLLMATDLFSEGQKHTANVLFPKGKDSVEVFLSSSFGKSILFAKQGEGKYYDGSFYTLEKKKGKWQIRGKEEDEVFFK